MKSRGKYRASLAARLRPDTTRPVRCAGQMRGADASAVRRDACADGSADSASSFCAGMKPRHKAFAVALGKTPPAEAAPAEEGAVAAQGGAETVFAPSLGASTSAAAGGAPGCSPPRAAPSAKREKKSAKAAGGAPAASHNLPQLAAAAAQPAAAPGAAPAAPLDEPSAETKRLYKGVYWCAPHAAPSARRCWFRATAHGGLTSV